MTHLAVSHFADTISNLIAPDPTTPSATPTSTPGGSVGTTEISSRGLTDWLKDNAVPLVIFVVGLGVALAARKGETSKVITVVGLLVVALAVIAMAIDSTLGISLGRWIVNLFVQQN